MIILPALTAAPICPPFCVSVSRGHLIAFFVVGCGLYVHGAVQVSFVFLLRSQHVGLLSAMMDGVA